jgi:4-hydroxy-tetrahydrodipicolinate reductase
VIFAGDQDMIEISHKAQNREIFAQGAIKAALWLSNGQQLATKLYHISDMLDITTVA